MTNKISKEYLAVQRKQVRDLQLGDEAWIPSCHCYVDCDGYLYVYSHTEVFDDSPFKGGYTDIITGPWVFVNPLPDVKIEVMPDKSIAANLNATTYRWHRQNSSYTGVPNTVVLDVVEQSDSN